MNGETSQAHSETPQARKRIDADPERLEQGLAWLVLAVIDLLRELMERQALRRVDSGELGEEEVERLGRTFMALSERMEELKDAFGLTGQDLTLDLATIDATL